MDTDNPQNLESTPASKVSPGKGNAPVKRVAVVTGGASGIGLEITRQLLNDGVSVVVGSRSAPGESQLLSQLFPDPADSTHAFAQSHLLSLPLDVRDSDSVAKFIEKASDKFGSINVLVNNAGASVHHSVCGHSEDKWQDVIDTNLTGPFRMIRACLPAMIENGWGRIVNIASTAAHTAVPTHAAYCSSKAGLLGLTRAVALEGAPHGVNCNSVSPTWVETDMLHSSAQKMAYAKGVNVEQIMKELQAANPQNRLVQASEIASVVAFLSGDASAGLTMEDIQVNAGAHW